jgi:RNA polymerase sigma-70 factor (ECF subfamily)
MNAPTVALRRSVSSHLQPLGLGRREGVRGHCDELMALAYDDLCRLAARMLHSERRELALSSTDLVHEAYTKLVSQARVRWRGRRHFIAIAAQAMRRILIDHARHCGRAKRGGDWRRMTLDSFNDIASRDALGLEDLLALDAALTKLSAIDHREAQVVELRFFVGLSNSEIAEVLDVSPRSVARDWAHARSWLRRELGPSLAATAT